MGKMLKDSDGVRVRAGDTITFSYGIPPVRVVAPVVSKNNRLMAITEGHNPSECPVSELMEHVGDFWVVRKFKLGDAYPPPKQGSK